MTDQQDHWPSRGGQRAQGVIDQARPQRREQRNAGPLSKDVTAATGRVHPNAGTENECITDCVPAIARFEPPDNRVGQFRSAVRCAPLPRLVPAFSAASKTLPSARCVYLTVRSGIVVTEQPADSQDVPLPHDGNAGVCMAKIVKPGIPQTCILNGCAARSYRGCLWRLGFPVPGDRKIHGAILETPQGFTVPETMARPCVVLSCVAEMEMTLAILLPLERCDFLLAATGQQQGRMIATSIGKASSCCFSAALYQAGGLPAP